MSKTPGLFAFIASAVLAFPAIAFAQFGGQGLGSALSNDPSSHQGQVRPGVDDTAGHAAQETPFTIIKDVKLGLKDADPNVRVGELTKLARSARSRSERYSHGIDGRPGFAREA